MTKFTKIRKWAEGNGYEVKDMDFSYRNVIRVIVDAENTFECEDKESTVYYSIHGWAGNRGGLYMSHKQKPADGRFVRSYSDWYQSQTDMIMTMENYIRKYVKERV